MEKKGPMATKRTICRFWQSGACTKGAACGYAHGEDVNPKVQGPLVGVPFTELATRFWTGVEPGGGNLITTLA